MIPKTTFEPPPKRKPGQPITKEWLVSQCRLSDKGCWEIQLKPNSNRYCQIGKKKKLAHRLAYELWNGEIPQGMLVLHKCDNRSCINPEHLFCGTDLDNKLDAQSKGRLVGDAWHLVPRLLDHQVLAIRADPRSTRKIAVDYKIDCAQIWRIKAGKAYAYVS